ncbi:MAG: MoaD/ThiS family protein [Desulfobacteraceae bacterium]|nr:MoaD/ThiS family protein [Desulfobacteraceae bacterium]
MIKIELRLFADLSKYLPENSENFQISKNTSVEQLLLILGINKDRAKIIFINGRKKGLKDCMKQGDRVGIFPPVGGG